MTNTRYGFGDHITDSSLDLFSFVTASKYANTLVDDGLGGQEARFGCNVNIQSPVDAFNLINGCRGYALYAYMVCWLNQYDTR